VIEVCEGLELAALCGLLCGGAWNLRHVSKRRRDQNESLNLMWTLTLADRG